MRRTPDDSRRTSARTCRSWFAFNPKRCPPKFPEVRGLPFFARTRSRRVARSDVRYEWTSAIRPRWILMFQFVAYRFAEQIGDTAPTFRCFAIDGVVLIHQSQTNSRD